MLGRWALSTLLLLGPPESAPPTAEPEGSSPSGEAPVEDAGPPVAEEPALDELEFEELPEPEGAPPPEPMPEPEEEESAEPTSPVPAPEEDLQPRVEASKHGPRRDVQFPKVWLRFAVSPGPRWVGFGAGFTYFMIPHLGAGLDLHDTIYFNAPGTINVFELTPTLTFLALPRYRITPLLKAGVGGAFVSHQLGNYGHWVTQGGVAFMIGKRFFLSLLVGPTGYLPDSRFRRNFHCAFIDNPCSLSFALDLGFGVGF